MPTISFSVLRWVLGVLAFSVVIKAMILGRTRDVESTLIDFDTFYIAGRLGLQGRISDAYSAVSLFAAQAEFGGGQSFMPWTYPPPFSLVVAALAYLPISMAYALFMTITLIAFLAVTRKLVGSSTPDFLVCVIPIIAVVLACGQNGLLTGSLIGLTSLALLNRNWAGGVPIGFMIIKPHLALTMGAYLLFSRSWRMILTAVATSVGLCALATVIFGAQVWAAFIGSVSESATFLSAGYYPMHRMISVYALARTLNLGHELSMAAQVGSAAVAFGCTWLAFKHLQPRQAIGFTVILGSCVSPYIYDYDLGVFAVGLALLWPDISNAASRSERWILLALCWTLGVTGYATHFIGGVFGAESNLISVGALPLIATVVFMWRILQRANITVAQSGHVPQAHAG